MAARYDLYAGRGEGAAYALLRERAHGELSVWEPEAGRPLAVFLHHAVHDGPPEIWGHLANSNPMLNVLEQRPGATFRVIGPSAYIPSYWVDPTKGVPTSYYSWAQFEAEAALVRDREELLDLLNLTLNRFQPEGRHPPVDLSDKYWQGMTGAITGLKLTVRTCASRHKYGQNRPAETRLRIVEYLRERGEGEDLAVAEQVLAHLESPRADAAIQRAAAVGRGQ